MASGIHILVSDAPPTRLGHLVLAGQVVDAEPVVIGPLRVKDDYVLSAVFGGTGTYRHADGATQPINPGTVTLVRPHQPHWYGTGPGQRWTELFAVFSGPLFDTLAATNALPHGGPQHPQPAPAMPTLKAVLGMTPLSPSVAEHQLLDLARWLTDCFRSPTVAELSPPIAAAAERLTTELAMPVDLPGIAAEVGLSYETFRRRFVRELGQPPLAYRNTRRLRTAASLLRMTDMTIRSIARTLGYADEFHLSRKFRAHFGTSPSGYRR